MEGFAQADLDTRAQDEISLILTGETVEAEDWRAVDVIAPVDTPVNPDMPTPEQKAEGTRRLNEANKIRKEKKENWVNPELTAFLAGEDEKELRQAMVDVLRRKTTQTVFAMYWKSIWNMASSVQKNLKRSLVLGNVAKKK